MPIREENQTLATITFQNYFRIYEVLAGMTGTAKTEEDEFRKIYELVVQVPTNAPHGPRTDETDYIFTTAKEKYTRHRRRRRRAVRAGPARCWSARVSVEVSEMLSRLLERHGVEHHVLNAKQHEREAHIIDERRPEGR